MPRSAPSTKRWHRAGDSIGRGADGCAGGGELRGYGQSGRHRAAGLHGAAATAAAAATSAPRTRWRSPICPMPCATAPQIFTHAKVRHVSQEANGRWRVHFERQDGTPAGSAGGAMSRQRRHRRAGGRHSRLDRDPAALARARASPCLTGSAIASRPTATSSRLATAAKAPSTPSASATLRASTGSTLGPPSPARSRSSTRTTWRAA